MLCNTLYMQPALEQLRAEGYSVLDEDVARLSPLAYAHINMLGRYSFFVPETVEKGGLRPLRNPAKGDSQPEFPFRCSLGAKSFAGPDPTFWTNLPTNPQLGINMSH